MSSGAGNVAPFDLGGNSGGKVVSMTALQDAVSAAADDYRALTEAGSLPTDPWWDGRMPAGFPGGLRSFKARVRAIAEQDPEQQAIRLAAAQQQEDVAAAFASLVLFTVTQTGGIKGFWQDGQRWAKFDRDGITGTDAGGLLSRILAPMDKPPLAGPSLFRALIADSRVRVAQGVVDDPRFPPFQLVRYESAAFLSGGALLPAGQRDPSSLLNVTEASPRVAALKARMAFDLKDADPERDIPLVWQWGCDTWKPDTFEVMLRYLAYIIYGQPDRLPLVPLLIGPNGCGKNFLMEVVGNACQSYERINADQFLSTFNEYMRTRLVVIDEVQNDTKANFYDALKNNAQSGTTPIEVNVKYGLKGKVVPRAMFAMTTNNSNPLRITPDDRRIVVMAATGVHPSPPAVLHAKEQANRVRLWVDSHLERFLVFLGRYHDPARLVEMTSNWRDYPGLKRDRLGLHHDSMPAEVLILAEALADQRSAHFGRTVLAYSDIEALMASTGNRRPSHNYVLLAAQHAGLTGTAERYRLDGKSNREQVFYVADSFPAAKLAWSDPSQSDMEERRAAEAAIGMARLNRTTPDPFA